MEERGEPLIPRPPFSRSTTHRQRVDVALDSSDRKDLQPREPHFIPIPGSASALTSNYIYNESFTNGRNLGMGSRVYQTRPAHAKPSAIIRYDMQDFDVSTPSGQAALLRRRTYQINKEDDSKRKKRRKSRDGFEGARPYRGKEPLTPQTHDNRTGKGRVSTSNQRKENPLSLWEQPETEVVDIQSTPDRYASAIHISASEQSDSKRQKIGHENRRHIKIALDNGSSDIEPSDHKTKGDQIAHSPRRATEPIEIGSDEDVDASRPLAQNPAAVRHDLSSNRVTSRAQSPRPRMTLTKHDARSYNDSSAPLQYPDDSASDHEEGSKPQAQSELAKYDPEVFKLNSTTPQQTPLRSPYFAANSLHKPALDVTPSCSSPTSISKFPEILQGEAHKFAIRNVGGPVPVSRKGWSLLVSSSGFHFMTEKNKLQNTASIDSRCISNVQFVDDVHMLCINLKGRVLFFGALQRIFVIFEEVETNRFTKMIQDWSMDHPLFKRFSGISDVQRQRCREVLARAYDSTSRSAHDDDSEASKYSHILTAGSPTVSPIAARKASDCKDELSPGAVSPQIHSTPKATSDGREVYEAAISGKKTRPTPIALPKARESGESRDERHLVVAQEEVKTSLEADNGNNNNGLVPRTTRLATRAAEQKSTRDSRAQEPLLVYPQVKGQTSVTLYDEDLERLAPDQFLNDSIVEFYLRYNYDNLREEQKAQAHVFNTFFYERLTSSKDKVANYEAVKKWTSKGKGVDIFSKKFLVVPINESLHWYLAVVVNLDKVVFGPDVTRDAEVSFIDAVEDEIDDHSTVSEPTIHEIDNSNVLESIEDLHSASVSPIIQESVRDEPISEKDKISQTPPPEPTIDQAEAAKDVYDFCDEPSHNSVQKMSMTDAIRAAELAKHPSLRRSTRTTGNEAQAMEDLTLEDSIIDCDKPSARTYNRNSKRKNRKSGPGFSKAGKHIASDVPTIIILDSLNGTHNRVYEIMKDYLVREAQDKKNEILSTKQFATCKADLPRQDNYSDCGLFLIQYTQTLLSQPDVVPQLLNRVKFSTEAASKAHKTAFKNMFEIDRIPLRRKEMIEQIKQLSIPYRDEARRAEELRKHQRALAKLREADQGITEDSQEVKETSAPRVAHEPASSTIEVEVEKITPTPNTINLGNHEDSIDDLNCL